MTEKKILSNANEKFGKTRLERNCRKRQKRKEPEKYAKNGSVHTEKNEGSHSPIPVEYEKEV